MRVSCILCNLAVFLRSQPVQIAFGPSQDGTWATLYKLLSYIRH